MNYTIFRKQKIIYKNYWRLCVVKKAEIVEIIKDLDRRADELQSQETEKRIERFFINASANIVLFFYWLVTLGKLK